MFSVGSAAIRKSHRKPGISVIIKVRKACQHSICNMQAVPASAALRFCSITVCTAVCRIKIVKFMGRAAACIGSEQLPVFAVHLNVSETG